MKNKKLDLLRRIKNGESFEECLQEDSDYIKELRDDGLIDGMDVGACKEDRRPVYGWIDVQLNLKGQEEFERLRKLKNKLKAFFENKYIYGIIMLLIGMALGSGWTSLKKCLTNKNENPNTISAGVTNKFEDAGNVITNFIENGNASTNNLEVNGENLNEEN